jgi:hypothetical protein
MAVEMGAEGAIWCPFRCGICVYLCVVREELLVARHVAHLTRGALRTHATRTRTGVGRGTGRSAAAAATAVTVAAGGTAECEEEGAHA